MQSETKAKHKHIEYDNSSNLIWAKTHNQPLSFAAIPGLRKGLRSTLKKFNVTLRVRQNLCQSLTEILTNLIEHPIKKASFVDLKIRKNGHYIHFCIRDNSSPFLDFDKKVQQARQLKTDNPDHVSRRGLGLITELHPYIVYQTSLDAEDGYNHFCILEKSAITKPDLLRSPYNQEKSKNSVLRFSPQLFPVKGNSPIRPTADSKKEVIKDKNK